MGIKVVNRNHTKRLSELEAGDVFNLLGKYYMKTDILETADDGLSYRYYVCLSNGEAFRFMDSTQVTLCTNCEITVDE